ncbi:pyridoxamine 5'-phosphate oxidase family protein [Kibdelosporangium philippinense]|uniref:Pyridoxamine 5'-phosphate oxidase family protein n=1 Tax=Kibdelosporangium philippinense TaxID=211113 RepID=A0ABS8Z288_9PSEU|nr:pyridoxamine 5'-phosphate oxidase family protein [Kibdelosporangium philippinense]MCE7002056.1 pyridoxamine 5'-phosphate oxidase family protein [Kibdelosporangium philippinense]
MLTEDIVVSGVAPSTPIRVPLTINLQPVPEATAKQAVHRLTMTEMPYQFFRDRATGQGAVLYRHYDGDYGPLTPAPSIRNGPRRRRSTMDSEPRWLKELPREQSLRLLGSVSIGRMVFNQHALPAIRLLNHVVDDGAVLVRTHLRAAVLGTVGMVVAYEADAIDVRTRLGWSVVVTGVARLVTDSGQVVRYEQMLHPWVRQQMDYVIRIDPEIVTGYEMLDSAYA